MSERIKHRNGVECVHGRFLHEDCPNCGETRMRERMTDERLAQVEAELRRYGWSDECDGLTAEEELLVALKAERKCTAELEAEVTKLRARISKMIDDAFLRELRSVP